MLRGSDAGSDGEVSIEFVPNFMIHMVPDVWRTLLGHGRGFVQ